MKTNSEAHRTLALTSGLAERTVRQVYAGRGTTADAWTRLRAAAHRLGMRGPPGRPGALSYQQEADALELGIALYRVGRRGQCAHINGTAIDSANAEDVAIAMIDARRLAASSPQPAPPLA